MNAQIERFRLRFSSTSRRALFVTFACMYGLNAAYFVYCTVKSMTWVRRLRLQPSDVANTFLLVAIFSLVPMVLAFGIIYVASKLTRGDSCHEDVKLWLWMGLAVMQYPYAAMIRSLVFDLEGAMGFILKSHP